MPKCQKNGKELCPEYFWNHSKAVSLYQEYSDKDEKTELIKLQRGIHFVPICFVTNSHQLVGNSAIEVAQPLGLGSI